MCLFILLRLLQLHERIAYLGVWRMEDDCLYLKLSADSGDEIDASFPILISPSGEDLYFQRSRTGAGIPFLPDGTDSVGLLLYTG